MYKSLPAGVAVEVVAVLCLADSKDYNTNSPVITLHHESLISSPDGSTAFPTL